MDEREYWLGKLVQAENDGDEFAKRQAESKLAEIDEADRTQEREQRQQEEVESVVLPQDYDAYYGVQGLNEEIQNLLRQVIAAKNQESNEELAEVVESYKDRLSVAEAAVSELRERYTEATDWNHNYLVEIEQLKHDLHEANEARADAEEKRDNAVRAAEEANAEANDLRAENERLRRSEESLKAQINELEGMIRTFKTNKPAGGFQLTSTLPAITDDEAKARRDRDRLDLINRRLAEKYPDVPPLPVPPMPSATAPESDEEDVTEEAVAEQMERVEEAAEADAATFPVVQDDSGEAAAEGGAEEAWSDGAETEATTLAELAARIVALEKWKDSAEVRLTDLMG